MLRVSTPGHLPAGPGFVCSHLKYEVIPHKGSGVTDQQTESQRDECLEVCLLQSQI